MTSSETTSKYILVCLDNELYSNFVFNWFSTYIPKEDIVWVTAVEESEESNVERELNFSFIGPEGNYHSYPLSRFPILLCLKNNESYIHCVIDGVPAIMEKMLIEYRARNSIQPNLLEKANIDLSQLKNNLKQRTKIKSEEKKKAQVPPNKLKPTALVKPTQQPSRNNEEEEGEEKLDMDPRAVAARNLLKSLTNRQKSNSPLNSPSEDNTSKPSSPLSYVSSFGGFESPGGSITSIVDNSTSAKISPEDRAENLLKLLEKKKPKNEKSDSKISVVDETKVEIDENLDD